MTHPLPPDEELGTDPLLRPQLAGYLQRRRGDLERVAAYLPARDLVGIADIGHRMHGSGAMFGLPILSTLGRDLEAAAEAGDLVEITRIHRAIGDWLSQHGGTGA